MADKGGGARVGVDQSSTYDSQQGRGAVEVESQIRNTWRSYAIAKEGACRTVATHLACGVV